MNEITIIKNKKTKKAIGYLYATNKINEFLFVFSPDVSKTDRINKIKEIEELEKKTGLRVRIK